MQASPVGLRVTENLRPMDNMTTLNQLQPRNQREFETIEKMKKTFDIRRSSARDDGQITKIDPIKL